MSRSKVNVFWSWQATFVFMQMFAWLSNYCRSCFHFPLKCHMISLKLKVNNMSSGIIFVYKFKCRQENLLFQHKLFVVEEVLIDIKIFLINRNLFRFLAWTPGVEKYILPSLQQWYNLIENQNDPRPLPMSSGWDGFICMKNPILFALKRQLVAAFWAHRPNSNVNLCYYFAFVCRPIIFQSSFAKLVN